MKKLMLIFLTTFMKWRKGENQRNSGNHSSLMMRKKTVIIALLHLKYHLQESKKEKMNRIYDMMSTVHNIKKIADFMKREGKNLKEILNMITGRRNGWGNIWGIVAGKASKLC